jgi:hypothetical protein
MNQMPETTGPNLHDLAKALGRWDDEEAQRDHREKKISDHAALHPRAYAWKNCTNVE